MNENELMMKIEALCIEALGPGREIAYVIYPTPKGNIVNGGVHVGGSSNDEFKQVGFAIGETIMRQITEGEVVPAMLQ